MGSMRRTAVAALLVAVVGLWVVVPGARPAGAAPGTPSAERLVSPVPVAGSQRESDIAFDGTTFLVVWQDDRNGGEDIYGARLDGTGRLLDVGGIPISASTGSQTQPTVTGTGSGFFVAWADDRSGTSDIYGARVGANGSVQDPNGIPISTATNFQSGPDVTFDGTRTFVAWSDARSTGSWDVYGARLNGATVLDPNGIAISTTASFQWEPVVSFNGSSYMVAWEDGRDDSKRQVFAARVGTDGTLIHTTGFQVSGEAGGADPSIVWSGESFLIAYEGAAGVVAALLTPGGNILTPDIPLPASGGFDAHVAYGGGTFLVIWVGDGTRGARVDLQGEVVDTTARSITGSSTFGGDVAFGAGAHHVVRDAGQPFQPLDVVRTRVTPAMAVLDAPPRLVVLRSAFQNRAAIVFDGTNHLVAWADDRTGEANIYVARTTPGGQLLDPKGVPLTAVAGSDSFPSIVFDGTSYLVVWKNDPSGIDNASIRGQRVTKAGAPVGSAFVVSDAGNDQSEPDVGFDGTRFVVTWTDFRNGGADIYAARVLADRHGARRRGHPGVDGERVAVGAGHRLRRHPELHRVGRRAQRVRTTSTAPGCPPPARSSTRAASGCRPTASPSSGRPLRSATAATWWRGTRAATSGAPG